MPKSYKIRVNKKGMILKEDEVLWISKHQKNLERYVGKWIAVLGNKLIGTGDSVKDVMTLVKRKGIKELPLVTMAPKKDEGMYVLGVHRKEKSDKAWNELMVLSEKITKLWKGPGAVEEIREQREKTW